ncbi:MAG: SpoIIE family protein phosphatase [Armatimonadota bacterium]|nr:SpoIIE family protein phosphatase [Armatimonadota bacterium]
MARSYAGQIRRWRKLVEINKLLLSAPERQEALRQIVEAAPEFVGGKAAVLCLVDETDRRCLRVQAICGLAPSSLTADAVVVEKDISRTLEAAARLYPAQSHISCPLVFDKELLGALIVYDGSPDALKRGEEFLGLLADQAAIAVHNGELRERVMRKRGTLRALMEWIPDGVVVIDTPGLGVRLASRAAREMAGGSFEGMCNLSPDGSGDWAVFGPDSELTPLEEMPPVRAGLRGAVTQDAEYIVRRRDGTEAVTLCNAGPVKDEDGNIVGGVLSFRDITQRKTLERELADQNALLETTFGHMPVGLVLCEADSLRIISANPAAENMFGVKSGEMLGRTPAEYSPKIDGKYFERICRKAVEKDRAVRFQRFEFALPGSGQRYIDGFIAPISSQPGAGKRLLAILTDVTTRVSAQEAALTARAEAERRAAEFEAVISNIGDGVVVIDDTGVAVLANEAARKMMPAWNSCRDLRDWLKKANARNPDGSVFAPDQIPSLRTLKGEGVLGLEILVDGASGQDTVVSATVTPIRNKQGDVVASVSVFRDITKEKESRETARAAYEFEHKVSEKLQRVFRPSELPKVDGWEIAAAYRTAGERALLGGDAYDVFQMPDGKIGILIADVSGKGPEAAGQGATIRLMVRNYAREAGDPADILRKVGLAAPSELGEEDFVTIFFSVLDPSRGTLDYANAGHEQPLHVSERLGAPVRLDVTGRAVGLFEPPTFVSRRIKLESRDCLVLYTDGVTDARGAGPRMGVEGLEDLVWRQRELPATELVTCILGEALSRAGKTLPDDVAIIVLRALS